MIGCSGGSQNSATDKTAPDTATETAEHYNSRKKAEAFARARTAQGKNQAPSKLKWYQGGTLHNATINEWKSATEENKLATCADFVSKVLKIESMEAMRARAIELRACINEATRGIDTVDNESVITIAAHCGTILGY